jgi:hypothetical protein
MLNFIKASGLFFTTTSRTAPRRRGKASLGLESLEGRALMSTGTVITEPPVPAPPPINTTPPVEVGPALSTMPPTIIPPSNTTPPSTR